MKFTKERFQSIVQCLCVAFVANIGCLYLGLASKFPSVVVLLALAAVVVGLAVPPRQTGRLLGKGLATAIAVIHLVAVGLWCHFAVGDFLLNVRFRAMVRGADKIVIRDGGNLCCSNPDAEEALFEITNKAEIAEFNGMFRFKSQSPGCMCCGYPGIDWWRGGERIVVSAIHHGYELRIDGKYFDWVFSRDSRQRILRWMQNHCGEDFSRGIPRKMECLDGRQKIVMETWNWPETHDGRAPTMDDLRAVFTQKGKDFPACPSGGEYTLTFDKESGAWVYCSFHHDE